MELHAVTEQCRVSPTDFWFHEGQLLLKLHTRKFRLLLLRSPVHVKDTIRKEQHKRIKTLSLFIFPSFSIKQL